MTLPHLLHFQMPPATPPAMTLLHLLHFQIPPATRFTDCLPQKVQAYLECCKISIRFTTLRSEAPYRVPYFPVMPTFFVRLAMASYKDLSFRSRTFLSLE